MKKIISTFLLCTSLHPFLNATTTTPTAGIILTYNKNKLLSESKEGKALAASFEDKKRAAIEDLKQKDMNLRKESEILQKQLQQGTLLSQEKIRQKQRKISKEYREFQREQEIQEQELGIEFQEELAELHERLKPYVHQVFKEKKGTILFDTSRKDIEEFDEKTDITTDALKLADASEINKKSDPKKESKSA